MATADDVIRHAYGLHSFSSSVGPTTVVGPMLRSVDVLYAEGHLVSAGVEFELLGGHAAGVSLIDRTGRELLAFSEHAGFGQRAAPRTWSTSLDSPIPVTSLHLLVSALPGNVGHNAVKFRATITAVVLPPTPSAVVLLGMLEA